MTNVKNVFAAALAAVFMSPVMALAVNTIQPSGFVFRDVPVAPLSFPDYAPSKLGIAGNPKVKPQTFNYGDHADYKTIVVWYRYTLAKYGWHVDGERHNYPGPGDAAIIASRKGEALTVIVAPAAGGGCHVALIKLNSAK